MPTSTFHLADTVPGCLLDGFLLLINAGEGIDIDVFFFRQDKNKSMERIGRRIRLNRSKIKDTFDSNSDFDSLSESIQAGYYLKRGLSGSEELYYMSTLNYRYRAQCAGS